jgi:hypothetical protein
MRPASYCSYRASHASASRHAQPRRATAHRFVCHRGEKGHHRVHRRSTGHARRKRTRTRRSLPPLLRDSCEEAVVSLSQGERWPPDLVQDHMGGHGMVEVVCTVQAELMEKSKYELVYQTPHRVGPIESRVGPGAHVARFYKSTLTQDPSNKVNIQYSFLTKRNRAGLQYCDPSTF